MKARFARISVSLPDHVVSERASYESGAIFFVLPTGKSEITHDKFM